MHVPPWCLPGCPKQLPSTRDTPCCAGGEQATQTHTHRASPGPHSEETPATRADVGGAAGLALYEATPLPLPREPSRLSEWPSAPGGLPSQTRGTHSPLYPLGGGGAQDGAEAHLQALFGGWWLQGGSVVGSMGSLEPGHCLLRNNTALSGPSWVTRKGSGLRRQLVLNPLARHAGVGLRKVS